MIVGFSSVIKREYTQPYGMTYVVSTTSGIREQGYSLM